MRIEYAATLSVHVEVFVVEPFIFWQEYPTTALT